MINRNLVSLNNFKRGTNNISQIYRGQTLIWPTTPISQPSFNIGTGFNDIVWTMALQPDGKILVGGQFTSYNNQTINRIIRLNENGTRDTSFNIGTGFNNIVRSIIVQPDGKILVAGHFTNYNNFNSNRIIRLNENGSRDTSFNIGTGFNDNVNSIILVEDNKILAGGLFTDFDGGGVLRSNKLARLNPDGSRDTSFIPITIQNSGGITAVVNSLDLHKVNNNDWYLIGGALPNRGNLVAFRHVPGPENGGQGTTFIRYSNNNTNLNSQVFSVASINPQAFIGGEWINLTTQFAYGGGQFTSVDSISPQTTNRLVLFDTNTSYATYNPGFNGIVRNLKVLTSASNGLLDNRLLVGGQFTSYNNQPANGLVRLIPNLANNVPGQNAPIDPTFNIGTGFDNGILSHIINSIVIQPDGKILIGGHFNSFNNESYNNIIRLNEDGSTDTIS